LHGIANLYILLSSRRTLLSETKASHNVDSLTPRNEPGKTCGGAWHPSAQTTRREDHRDLPMQDKHAAKITHLARRLIEYETDITIPAPEGDHDSPAFRVCEKLRQPLSRLAGAAGFRSLLSRALALAGSDVRWVKAIHVAANGSLEGLDDARIHVSPFEINEGEVVVVAQLIGLLVMFIGGGLTMRLIHEAWPREGFEDEEI